MIDFQLANTLYVITESSLSARSNQSVVESALRGGAKVIQLREKNWSKDALIECARDLRYLCKQYNAAFLVNDHVDVAEKVGADGVHLGQDDMPVKKARKILGKDKIIGLSTHSVEQVLDGNNTDADYLAIGPIFPTRSKNYSLGVDILEQAVAVAEKPLVAIGGIDSSNIASVLQAGITNVAVIKAVFGADDATFATQKLLDRLLS